MKEKFNLVIKPTVPIELRHKIYKLIEEEGYKVHGSGQFTNGSSCDINFSKKENKMCAIDKKLKKLKEFEKIKEIATDEWLKEKNISDDKYYATVEEGDTFYDNTLLELLPKIDNYLKWFDRNSQDNEYPDKIELRQDGIYMIFDADHPNDKVMMSVAYNKIIK